MPSDANADRPGIMFSELVNFCSSNGKPLFLGSDTNSHHTLWGSTNINSYGEELVEYLASTNLEILNRGNEPTFVTSVRKEVLDVSFASRSFLNRISKWRVSREETASDQL